MAESSCPVEAKRAKMDTIEVTVNNKEDIESGRELCGQPSENSSESSENSEKLREDSLEGLSKKAKKRLAKAEAWRLKRNERRAREKARMKQKKQEAREKNLQFGIPKKVLKAHRMSTSSCKVNVVIDLSFDDLMSNKVIPKLVKQIHRCYSLNRQLEDPLQYYLTSFGGKTQAEIGKHTGYKNWDVHFKTQDYVDVFKKEQLVYLTSESDNVVHKFEDGMAYIIGGLVDHNANKGHCFNVAVEKGVSHARLPLSEYVDMKTRKVLTIDQVFLIIMRVSHGVSWQDTLLEVLPQRKGAIVKT